MVWTEEGVESCRRMLERGGPDKLILTPGIKYNHVATRYEYGRTDLVMNPRNWGEFLKLITGGPAFYINVIYQPTSPEWVDEQVKEEIS